MGAAITVANERDVGGEPVADITAESGPLRAVSIGGALIPRLIDEVPVLAVAAAVARAPPASGTRPSYGSKSPDRLAAVAGELGKLGARIEEHPDGLTITGDGWPAGKWQATATIAWPCPWPWPPWGPRRRC